MSGIFGHTVFGGGGGGVGPQQVRRGVSGLGGVFDDLFGDNEDVAGDVTGTTTGTTAGAGPKVQDQTIITGTPGPAAVQSPGAMPKFGTCLPPYIDDPKNPAAFCILDPKGNYNCPTGQVYDTFKKGCVKYTPDLIVGATPQTGVICPYGTKAVGKACVSLVGGGTTPASVPAKTPAGGGTTPATVDPKNALMGGKVPTWAIALAGIAIVGGVGAAVYAKKKHGRS